MVRRMAGSTGPPSTSTFSPTSTTMSTTTAISQTMVVPFLLLLLLVGGAACRKSGPGAAWGRRRCLVVVSSEVSGLAGIREHLASPPTDEITGLEVLAWRCRPARRCRRPGRGASGDVLLAGKELGARGRRWGHVWTRPASWARVDSDRSRAGRAWTRPAT